MDFKMESEIEIEIEVEIQEMTTLFAKEEKGKSLLQEKTLRSAVLHSSNMIWDGVFVSLFGGQLLMSRTFATTREGQYSTRSPTRQPRTKSSQSSAATPASSANPPEPLTTPST